MCALLRGSKTAKTRKKGVFLITLSANTCLGLDKLVKIVWKWLLRGAIFESDQYFLESVLRVHGRVSYPPLYTKYTSAPPLLWVGHFSVYPEPCSLHSKAGQIHESRWARQLNCVCLNTTVLRKSNVTSVWKHILSFCNYHIKIVLQITTFAWLVTFWKT